MASVSSDLVWEIVKKHNAFLVKQFGNSSATVQFSKEKNNLYNLHAHKYSGLANKKTVSIQPAADGQSIEFATTIRKKMRKPAQLYHKSVMKNKSIPKMAKAVINQVRDNNYRPDLTKAALARLSYVTRALRVAKSGQKRRNRQRQD